MTEIKLLLLIIIANGVPVLLSKLLQKRLDTPLDFNRLFIDGRPLFGVTKTLRGVIAAILVTSLAAVLLNFEFMLGFVIAALAMLGDLLTSFIKRRCNMPPSSRALGLDQIPESLLPMLACHSLLELDWRSVLTVVVLFFIAELVLSGLFYRLHIRKRPY